MDRRLQSLGLTQAQWRAIVHLSRSEGMTQATLAESLEIQPITLTRLIDRMESAGWVERRTHPLDRRAVQLYLTPQSQPILERDARARRGHDERSDTRPHAARATGARRHARSRSSRTSIAAEAAALSARAIRNHASWQTKNPQARPRPRLTQRPPSALLRRARRRWLRSTLLLLGPSSR